MRNIGSDAAWERQSLSETAAGCSFPEGAAVPVTKAIVNDAAVAAVGPQPLQPEGEVCPLYRNEGDHPWPGAREGEGAIIHGLVHVVHYFYHAEDQRPGSPLVCRAVREDDYEKIAINECANGDLKKLKEFESTLEGGRAVVL